MSFICVFLRFVGSLLRLLRGGVNTLLKLKYLLLQLKHFSRRCHLLTLCFDHLIRQHFVLRNEFVLQRCGASTHENREVDNLPRTRIVSILDVKGIAVADITTDVLAFLRISGQVVDNHYPGLVAKLIVCNAPSWFWTVWGMIARVLPESTRESIQIIGDTSALDQYIDKAMRPEEYGGTDVPLGQRTEFTSFVELGQGWENEGYVLYETLAEAREAKKREREEVAAAFQASRVSGVEAAQQKTWDSDSDESSEWEVVDGLTDDDDVGRGYHEHHAVSKDSSQSQSIYGWIRNGFKRPEQRHAYLGEKNCFRYDEERGEWRMSHPLPYSTPKRERRESRSASMESAGSPSGGHFPSGIGTFSAQKGGMRAEHHSIPILCASRRLENLHLGPVLTARTQHHTLAQEAGKFAIFQISQHHNLLTHKLFSRVECSYSTRNTSRLFLPTIYFFTKQFLRIWMIPAPNNLSHTYI